MNNEGRKRNAIHSGIGDNSDLLVKRPEKENITESFKYAARLRGKKRHDTKIYPEVPFKYGISYKGEKLETYNEKDYEFGVNAHPEKSIAYCIEEKKELPVKRLWEAKACFEAEVKRYNLKYAINYKGHTGKIDKRTAEYAVNWVGQYTVKNHGDVKSLFTDASGQYIGYRDGTTGWHIRSNYVADIRNRPFFSGVIAKNMYKWNSYEAAFSFKPILNDGAGIFGNTMRYNWSTRRFYKAGRWDDDVIGLIFQAKDSRNFYMMMWEGEERVWRSSRAGNNLDGINIFTMRNEFVNRSVISATTRGRPTHSQWVDYCNNKGWGRYHRRIYKVTNGVLRRVNVKDRGSGKGWIMNSMHRVRVVTAGRNVRIYARTSPRSSEELVYDFNTDWGNGAFGMFNVSQSVQFHGIDVVENKIISGRIPSSGWDRSKDPSKTIASNATTYVKGSSNFKSRLPSNIKASAVKMLSITGAIRKVENGSIGIYGKTGRIVVKAKDYTNLVNYKGRIPSKGWFEFDGIGSYSLTNNAQNYIRDHLKKPDLILDEISSTVQDPTAGRVVIGSKLGAIVAVNNNAPDVGKVYKECFLKCGIVEVTPDHRDYYTGLLVWADISTVFREEHKKFFNRPDYINKKETYELLKPVWIEPPKPPPEKRSEAGCIIEELPLPDEEPIIECLNDFDFDGKKLVMWSCEFPVVKTKKCFEDKVYAYRGWMTFNPLVNFEANKWTEYDLHPIEATINPEYDEIKWVGRDDYEKAPAGTKVIIRTKEWYKAIFPADIVNKGIVTSEQDIESEIPPAPEHFFHPVRTSERMPDHFNAVHYLLDAWSNHSNVIMWFKSNPGVTTENVDRRPESLTHEGPPGVPIILTANDNDKIVIHCKDDPRYIPWSSGKYLGYGKVNGKRPYWGDGAGKADMVNVSTEALFFPKNLVKETLEGPFIDVLDEEYPDYPRVKYRLHSDNKLIDFYSDFTDSYIWYTDWYSSWIESEDIYKANMHEEMKVESPIDLDPFKLNPEDNYNPDNTIIERIEVTSDNPFVNLWIREDKGPYDGLIGNYYKVPLTASIFKESWRVTGNYQEWSQVYNVRDYMEKIEIPIYHPDFTIIEVKLGGEVVPKSTVNGWDLVNGEVKLYGSALTNGLLEIKYSTGDINNTFTLEKDLGTHIEVYVNGVLLDPIDYSFDKRIMTINKHQLYIHDHIQIQSYRLNDFHDPTKKNYLGERKYSQIDFQEDLPTTVNNPNYNDPYYEGAFCFNWGYKRPVGFDLPSPQDFYAQSMFLSDTVQFRFNADMEVVHPVAGPVDISNFTGTWVQWDQQPFKMIYNKDLGKYERVYNDPPVWGDGMGDWHGPPEKDFPKVVNLINQSKYSGWYNPEHVNLTDYHLGFKVECRSIWDDDIYGATFRFNPETMEGYTFEWDAGGGGIRGMTIFKIKCTNPEAIGTGEELYFTHTRLAYDPELWDPVPTNNQRNPNRKFYTHDVRISCIGGTFKVYVNGVLKMEAYDPEPYKKGAWGPITRSNPDTYFWDFWLQTYRRVTFKEEPSFRKLYQIEKMRPKITSEDPFFLMELKEENVQAEFDDIIDDFCKRRNVNRSSLVSIEYQITNDQSDYSVYFKHPKLGEQGTMTFHGDSKFFSNVMGQYPDIEDPSGINIPSPDAPNIPGPTPPKESNPNDGFTITWDGYLYAPKTGVYKFKATVNDGFRLWIKGVEVINEWHVITPPDFFPDYEGSIFLEGGKWHPIRAHYFDNIGQALIRLHWAQPEKNFQRIHPKYLTPYLGYKLFAQVKKATPLPWSPMIHNGYYYHKDKEHYLYAKKTVLKRTPNQFYEITLEPRPKQGSPIIVRDNQGNNLRKVTFYDGDWSLTLENKEQFHGNGYAKYYLSYNDIDPRTVKVSVNGKILNNHDYFFRENESAIEFMEELTNDDFIEIRYILLYSYYLDMNADMKNGMVNKDISKIKIHSNYESNLLEDMEIIYEAAEDTPFYQADEMLFNPILNNNHTGFLYIVENKEQVPKDMTIRLSEKNLSTSGLEKILLTVRVFDKYNNPCPNKKVSVWRDGKQIEKDLLTNSAGEIYVYDQPNPPPSKISIYKVTCESIMKETLLNYYVNNQAERFYLEMETNKFSVMAGVEDKSLITITLRDSQWLPVGEGENIRVEYRNSFGEVTNEELVTNKFGQIHIYVSGQSERHGNIMVKASYNMGFEEASNMLYLKVIGG